MRVWIAGLALLAAACDSAPPSADGGAPAAQSGYVLEVHATDGEQTYVVTAPDGATVGARAAGGASALMDASAMQAFAATPPPEPVTDPAVSFRAPGLSLAISGDETADGEGGNVAIAVGGQTINVDAQDGGETGDRAHVRIAGVSAQDARDFINEAEELSPEVRTQMLAALNLEQ